MIVYYRHNLIYKVLVKEDGKLYKTLMIVNLESGRGNFEKKLSFIVMELKYKEFDVTIKYTQKDFGADKIIENYKTEYDLLIVCGGDGTLNQATSALTRRKKNVSIAYIPTGTTNDFANTLGLPKNGVMIARNLINSKALKTDTGKFNNKYFNYVAAFGAFTEVSYQTQREKKRKLGWLAYIITGIKELGKIKPYKLKITFNDEVIEDEFLYGGITNSLRIGGFKWFKPKDISLNDGKFEVILIKKPKNFFGYFGILKSIILKDYSKDPNIIFSQDSNLKIDSEEQIEWTLDGEDAGYYNKIEINNLNKNIEFLIM